MNVMPPQLGAVLAVARDGSIQGAARQLGVTPSAVSQQLGKLEQRESLTLFERRDGRLHATPSGEVVVGLAERIEAEVAEARRRLAESTRQVSGEVVIGAFQTAIRSVFVPLIEVMSRDLPGVRIRLIEGDEVQLDRWLRAGDVHLAVVESDGDLPTTVPADQVERPLVDDPWLVALPSGSSPPSSVDALAAEPWLRAQTGGASARALARLEGRIGRRLEAAHEYFEFSVALALVAAHQGVALLPALGLYPPIPPGVVIARYPGLGHRQLGIRHLRRAETDDEAMRTVMERAARVAARQVTGLGELIRTELTSPA